MNDSQLDFGPLRSKTAPEATPLPGARKELPKYPFVMSYPDPKNLPIMEANAAMREALAEVGSTTSVYPDTQGYPPLREFIAQRLGEKRNMSVDPDDILLTEGSGQAIHFVTEALVDPGDAVIVDDFVYGGTLWSLRRFGADIRGVVSDADGMLPDALEETLDQAEADGKRTKMVYLIHTFQNPQTWTMPVEDKPTPWSALPLGKIVVVPSLSLAPSITGRCDPTLPRTTVEEPTPRITERSIAGSAAPDGLPS